MIFCDTSTLAKYYVTEAESVAVRIRLDQEDRVFLSDLARGEIMGVFHRRWREKKWTRKEFQTVARQFAQDDSGGLWTWVPLEGVIVDQAVSVYLTLPETIFLRTADCLHLVTARHLRFTEIYSHDAHQLQAAASLGLRATAIK